MNIKKQSRSITRFCCLSSVLSTKNTAAKQLCFLMKSNSIHQESTCFTCIYLKRVGNRQLSMEKVRKTMGFMMKATLFHQGSRFPIKAPLCDEYCVFMSWKMRCARHRLFSHHVLQFVSGNSLKACRESSRAAGQSMKPLAHSLAATLNISRSWWSRLNLWTTSPGNCSRRSAMWFGASAGRHPKWMQFQAAIT